MIFKGVKIVLQLEVSYRVVSEMQQLVSSEMEWAGVALAHFVEDDKHSVVDSEKLTKSQKQTYVECLEAADVALLEAIEAMSRARTFVRMVNGSNVPTKT